MYRDSGCVYRQDWRRLCTGCSYAFNRPADCRIEHAVCGNPYQYGRGHFYSWFAIYQSYRCHDDYNDLVPKPSNTGASSPIATNIDSSVVVTFGFKYTAKVGSSDECRIYKCQLLYNPISNPDAWTKEMFDCPQTVAAGQVGTGSKKMTVKANSASNRFYGYWVDTTPYSLSCVSL